MLARHRDRRIVPLELWDLVVDGVPLDVLPVDGVVVVVDGVDGVVVVLGDCVPGIVPCAAAGPWPVLLLPALPCADTFGSASETSPASLNQPAMSC